MAISACYAAGSLIQITVMRKKTFWRISIPALLLTSGCAALFQPKTTTPIPYTVYGDIKQAQHITVLLPGIRDRQEDFSHYGFIDIAQPALATNPHTALITVDAHWGYYRERSIDTRLAEDILARYPDKRITFVGISLGGFGSLLMATKYPDRIARLVLLSPFLGEDDYDYLQRLQTLGPIDQPDDEDLQRTLNQVWQFLDNDKRQIPITLAYGESDKFAPYYDHLRSLNPKKLTFMPIRGAHDWDTWRSLWTALAPVALMAP